MDEKDAELLAYEVAYLERNGWILYSGRWKHPDPPHVAHTRHIAVGLQKIRDKRASDARFPRVPPPEPSRGEATTKPNPALIRGSKVIVDPKDRRRE